MGDSFSKVSSLPLRGLTAYSRPNTLEPSLLSILILGKCTPSHPLHPIAPVQQICLHYNSGISPYFLAYMPNAFMGKMNL